MREYPQMKLRMPPELKDLIEKSSKDSGRSMNAEIVHRLDESFLKAGSVEIDRILSAEQARIIAHSAQENKLEHAKKECLAVIHSAANKGMNCATFEYLEFFGVPDEEDVSRDTDPSLFQNYIDPLIQFFSELGYTVEDDGESLFVHF